MPMVAWLFFMLSVIAQVVGKCYLEVMSIIRFLFLITLLFSLPVQAGNGKIAVVELFTSQGCSDTFEVEEIFEKIGEVSYQNLILLSCHTTYFDTDTWKDSLSLELCDERLDLYQDPQGLFASKAPPQIIINGRFPTSGKKENLIRAGIKMAHALDEIIPVQLSFQENTLDIILPEIKDVPEMDVWLLAYNKKETALVSDRSDADTKKTLTHFNPVVQIKKLFLWDGSPISTSASLQDFLAEGYVVIAQYSGGSTIVAAGKVER